MTTITKRPTVEIFYELYAHQAYEPDGYYCVDSEFVSSYVNEKKSFIDDELYIEQEKEFVLTTLKKVGAT